MNVVAERMHDLLLDVAEGAEAWSLALTADAEGEGEFMAHEALVHAVLAFADEYAGFEQIQRALAGEMMVVNAPGEE